MEQIKTATEIMKVHTHSFFCDQCGKFLGTSVERDDGWYERFGDDTDNHQIFGQYMKFKPCLCDECKAKIKEKAFGLLRVLGFTEKDPL